jgi:hypothetical protein
MSAPARVEDPVQGSPADDDPEDPGLSDVSVAIADAPSTSGAHWANRDNQNIYRRGRGRSTPFRRPNALNSFPGGDRAEGGGAQDPEPTSWWRSPSSSAGGRPNESSRLGPYRGGRPASNDTPVSEDASAARGDAVGYSASIAGKMPYSDFLPEPAAPSAWDSAADPDTSAAPRFGPAPPATGGRVSFGVTAGPIGGYRPGYGPDTPAGPRPAGPAASPAAGPAASAAGPMPVPDAGPVPVPRSAPLIPPRTGHTGEIFDGPAREIRAHRALKEHTPPRGTPVAGAPPKRSRGVTVAALALAGVVVLGGALGGFAYFSGGDDGLGSVLKLGVGRTDGRTATAALDGRTTASFEMVAAAGRVTVRSQDLGDDLYKITTAGDSGMVPSPAVSADRVQLQLTPDGDTGTRNVTVVLSSKVRWSLRFTGGADEQLVDFRGGRVSEVQLTGGARRAELTLARPAGTVPIHVTGALDELSVTSPADAPVRVRVESGAKTVVAGTRTLRDLAPGSTLTPKDWRVRDRYDLDAASRVTLLSVDATR